LGSKKALILLIFIVIGILPCSYANEYAIFEQNQKKGLKDHRGKEIIPAEYDDIGWSDGQIGVFDGIIGYKINENWGLINLKNSKLTTAKFSDLIPGNKSIIASVPDSYKLNNLFGLISPSGKTIISFKYNSIEGFGNIFIVGKKIDGDILYAVISHKDELILPFDYFSASRVTNNIYALKNFDQELVLIDPYGSFLLDTRIDDVEIFANQLLLISKNGNKGLIDYKGAEIAPVNFQKFTINENGIIKGQQARDWRLLSDSGKPIDTLSYDFLIPINSGYYRAKRLNYSFITNDKGEEIFKIKNSEIQFLNDSLALFESKNRFGVINYTGDTIIETRYDAIKISGNRFFLYLKKPQRDGWTLSDLYGVILSPQEFDALYHLDHHDIAFKKNGFWGIMDNYGNEKIFAKYDSIYSKINDLFLVNFYGEKGVVDAYGEWKVFPQKGDVFLLENGDYLISSYFQSRVISKWGNELFVTENYLKPFRTGFIEEDFENNFGLLDLNFNRLLQVDNLFVGPIVQDSAFLFKNESGWGIVDIFGHVLFEADNRFEQIIGYNEEYIGVKIDGYYGFIDLNGKLRIANRYEGIELFNNGMANIKILNKWGTINKQEQIVVQPYYDQIGSFNNNLAIAQKNSKYGIVNNFGKTVIAFDYDSLFRIQNGNFICELNSKYGLVNNQGEIMFYPKYESILDLDNGYVIAERKNIFGVFSSSGVFIIPVKYDQIIFDPYKEIFLVTEDPEWEYIMDLKDAITY
jgi:hypothetical protein